MNKRSQRQWKYRRRIIFLALAFCAGATAWCLTGRVDTELAETAILALCGLSGSIIGSYVFGAAWDDRNAEQRALTVSTPSVDASGCRNGDVWGDPSARQTQ